ncbi:unnamed protein product [Rotaria sordida]|uniref:Deacetylase sirtuin-type domain-containing protein n=1 Tax=Rotaria sordida TaxID=392033 RepID=A0A814A5I2_9BILA|nr:unnamed protein product [Rotaria sordida]CAF1309429.1 unnamed protein product [Rotaria sordida]
MSKKDSRTYLSDNNRNGKLKDLSNRLSKIEITSKSIRENSNKKNSLDKLIESIKNGQYNKIVVIVGAGISTASGIPDFRTPGTGLYDNLQRYNIPYPEAIFELNYFNKNSNPFFHLAKELYPGKYFPNINHYFIRYLYENNILHRVYTQNIDGLERMAGIPPDKIVEAHGTFMSGTCQKCHKKYSCEDIRQDIFNDKIPICSKMSRCNGIIKPDIVFFDEDLPQRFELYRKDLPMSDCCIVMGTSLSVYPFADIVDLTKHSTVRLLINRQLVGTFLKPRTNDITLIGDLETNIKDILTKLDAFHYITDLMKKENDQHEYNKKSQYKNHLKSSTTILNDRLKAAQTYLKEKEKFSRLNSNRQQVQLITKPNPVSYNESTKIIIEKHNDALLFNRKRSKSALPHLPSKQSSSSSSSSSSSLNSSLSECELMPFSFKRPSDSKTQSSRQIQARATTKVKINPLLNATLRTVF